MVSCGYSRLMGADEEGTLERLKALRRELVDPKIAEHHGRIIKTTGDGMLVEFARSSTRVRGRRDAAADPREREPGGRIMRRSSWLDHLAGDVIGTDRVAGCGSERAGTVRSGQSTDCPDRALRSDRLRVEIRREDAERPSICVRSARYGRAAVASDR